MTGTHAAARRDDEPHHPAFQQTAAELETRIRFLLATLTNRTYPGTTTPQEEK